MVDARKFAHQQHNTNQQNQQQPQFRQQQQQHQQLASSQHHQQQQQQQRALLASYGSQVHYATSLLADYAQLQSPTNIYSNESTRVDSPLSSSSPPPLQQNYYRAPAFDTNRRLISDNNNNNYNRNDDTNNNNSSSNNNFTSGDSHFFETHDAQAALAKAASELYARNTLSLALASGGNGSQRLASNVDAQQDSHFLNANQRSASERRKQFTRRLQLALKVWLVALLVFALVLAAFSDRLFSSAPLLLLPAAPPPPSQQQPTPPSSPPLRPQFVHPPSASHAHMQAPQSHPHSPLHQTQTQTQIQTQAAHQAPASSLFTPTPLFYQPLETATQSAKPLNLNAALPEFNNKLATHEDLNLSAHRIQKLAKQTTTATTTTTTKQANTNAVTNSQTTLAKSEAAKNARIGKHSTPRTCHSSNYYNDSDDDALACSGNGVCLEGACYCFAGFSGLTCDKNSCKRKCSSNGKCELRNDWPTNRVLLAAALALEQRKQRQQQQQLQLNNKPRVSNGSQIGEFEFEFEFEFDFDFDSLSAAHLYSFGFASLRTPIKRKSTNSETNLQRQALQKRDRHSSDARAFPKLVCNSNNCNHRRFDDENENDDGDDDDDDFGIDNDAVLATKLANETWTTLASKLNSKRASPLNKRASSFDYNYNARVASTTATTTIDSPSSSPPLLPLLVTSELVAKSILSRVVRIDNNNNNNNNNNKNNNNNNNNKQQTNTNNNNNNYFRVYDNRLQWHCECSLAFAGNECEQQRELTCNDHIDNDNDNSIDCDDDDCCASDACSDHWMCFKSPQPQLLAALHATAADSLPTAVAEISAAVVQQQQQKQAGGKLTRGGIGGIGASGGQIVGQNHAFFTKLKFLIEKNSVQLYAKDSAFDKSRVAVIRGRIVKARAIGYSNRRAADNLQTSNDDDDNDDNEDDDVYDNNSALKLDYYDTGSQLDGLVGVRVSVADSSVLGFSLSRSDGSFDLLVNGDEWLTLTFLKTSYAPVERRVFARKNTINVLLEPVLMALQNSSSLLGPAAAAASAAATLTTATTTINTAMQGSSMQPSTPISQSAELSAFATRLSALTAVRESTLLLCLSQVAARGRELREATNLRRLDELLVSLPPQLVARRRRNNNNNSNNNNKLADTNSNFETTTLQVEDFQLGLSTTLTNAVNETLSDIRAQTVASVVQPTLVLRLVRDLQATPNQSTTNAQNGNENKTDAENDNSSYDSDEQKFAFIAAAAAASAETQAQFLAPPSLSLQTRQSHAKRNGPATTAQNYTAATNYDSDAQAFELKAVIVQVQVEGQLHSERLTPHAMLNYNFFWNKRNVYDQKVYGVGEALVRVGFEFRALATRFALPKLERCLSEKASFLSSLSTSLPVSAVDGLTPQLPRELLTQTLDTLKRELLLTNNDNKRNDEANAAASLQRWQLKQRHRDNFFSSSIDSDNNDNYATQLSKEQRAKLTSLLSSKRTVWFERKVLLEAFNPTTSNKLDDSF